MEQGHSLIDAAVKKCGSRYALSKRTGIPESTLSFIYSGKRGMSPVVAAKLAAEAGLDAREAAAVAMIESEKDPKEREALKRVFFRSGAAALLAICIGATSFAPSTATGAEVRPIDGGYQNSPACILCQIILWLRRAMKAALTAFRLRSTRRRHGSGLLHWTLRPWASGPQAAH